MGYTDERKYPDFKRLISKYKKSEDNKNKNIKTEKNDYSEVVDLLIISHFHLDHCGALPYFTEILGYKNPILCSQPTKAILPEDHSDPFDRGLVGSYLYFGQSGATQVRRRYDRRRNSRKESRAGGTRRGELRQDRSDRKRHETCDFRYARRRYFAPLAPFARV